MAGDVTNDFLGQIEVLGLCATDVTMQCDKCSEWFVVGGFVPLTELDAQMARALELHREKCRGTT